MANFIFIPANDMSLPQEDRQLQEARRQLGKSVPTVIDYGHMGGRTPGVLACVGPLDTLYISGHSNGITLAYQRHKNNWTEFSAERLAALLEHEELTYQIGRIKVFGCHTGGRDGVESPFAHRLKRCLLHLGYSRVVVFGYTEDVVQNYSQRLVPGGVGVELSSVHKGGGPIHPVYDVRARASVYRVAF
jgi:hypothetical protein